MEPITAILVFLFTACMDILHTVYTKAVIAGRPVLAATSGAVIYIVSAYAVIKYTQDHHYVIMMVAGSWVGTYIIVRFRSKK